MVWKAVSTGAVGKGWSYPHPMQLWGAGAAPPAMRIRTFLHCVTSVPAAAWGLQPFHPAKLLSERIREHQILLTDNEWIFTAIILQLAPYRCRD